MLESGIGRAHNLHLASLPNFSLPHDLSASRRYYKEDIIDPFIELSGPGTIRVPGRAGESGSIRSPPASSGRPSAAKNIAPLDLSWHGRYNSCHYGRPMTPELTALATTAATLGFLHTVAGPDHYLPFIVMSKARKWSTGRTLAVTALCGLGHVGSSILIGAIGIAFGLGVARLEVFEGFRGDVAAWLFILFGLGYFLWGLNRGLRNRGHHHIHVHGDGSVHADHPAASGPAEVRAEHVHPGAETREPDALGAFHDFRFRPLRAADSAPDVPRGQTEPGRRRFRRRRLRPDDDRRPWSRWSCFRPRA